MDADEFVIRNLTNQVNAFKEVITTMRTHLDRLPAEDRAAIDEASMVLRKSPGDARPCTAAPDRGNP